MNRLNKLKEFIIKSIPGCDGFQFFYNSGVDAYSKKQYEKAIDNFKLAIRQKGLKPQVYYNLALTYQNIGDYDRAIANYHNFLEHNSNDYDGHYNLALIYLSKENLTKAIELFEKCIKIKEDANGIKALVSAYINNDQLQKALDLVQQVLSSEKEDLQLNFELAKIFEKKKAFGKSSKFLDLAIEIYLNIINKNTEFFDAYLSISICYAKKGEVENSIKYCQKALELDSMSYDANSQMGLLYYCSEDIDNAVKFYEKAFALKPKDDYKAYLNLGYAYEKLDKKEQAIEIFTQLLQIFPEFPAKDEIKNHLRVLKKI